MADKYLKIALTGAEAGTVVNTVMMEPTDTFDPAYRWTKVTPDEPHPGIGHKVQHAAAAAVTTGNSHTFTPFKLSEASGGFTISYDGRNVNIDCKSFDMRWLRKELTVLCRSGLPKGELTHASRNGVLYDGYCIAWSDAHKILLAIESLRP